MDPPCHPLPVTFPVMIVDQPRHDDTGRRANKTVCITPVPDMVGGGGCIGGTVEIVAVAEFVDLRRAVTGADMQASERGLQRLQQFIAQMFSGLDGKVGIFRNVGNAIKIGDLLMQEIAQEKALRQPHPAKLFQPLHRIRLAHDGPRLASLDGSVRRLPAIEKARNAGASGPRLVGAEIRQSLPLRCWIIMNVS
ncbi:hypothetical protein EDF70_104189 [Neorhizobium sp. JUb45]|nr:hypothetical protein EDF70_104189 [Neorhizobium sp. JUb45]